MHSAHPRRAPATTDRPLRVRRLAGGRVAILVLAVAVSPFAHAGTTAAPDAGEEPEFEDNDCARDQYADCRERLQRTYERCKDAGRGNCRENLEGQKVLCEGFARGQCD